MIILALDLATATGCCDGPVGGAPRLWSWFLRDAGDSRPMRFAMLATFLRRYFAQERCDAVVYEAPMPLGMLNSHPVKGGNKGFFQSTAAETGDSGLMLSEANVAFARGAIGVLECECALASKPVESIKVQEARGSVLGWRVNYEKRSGIKTKARVQRDVKLLGIPFENDNEADTYVLWGYACALQNPRLAAAYTPLFRHVQGD